MWRLKYTYFNVRNCNWMWKLVNEFRKISTWHINTLYAESGKSHIVISITPSSFTAQVKMNTFIYCFKVQNRSFEETKHFLIAYCDQLFILILSDQHLWISSQSFLKVYIYISLFASFGIDVAIDEWLVNI